MLHWLLQLLRAPDIAGLLIITQITNLFSYEFLFSCASVSKLSSSCNNKDMSFGLRIHSLPYWHHHTIQSIHPSIYPPTYLSIYPSIYIFIFVCLCVCIVSVHVYLSTWTCVSKRLTSNAIPILLLHFIINLCLRQVLLVSLEFINLTILAG